MRSIAWLVAMAMALLFSASPVLAQTAPVPEQYRNADEFGVDQVTGSYNFSIVEGQIGPEGTGIQLVRTWTRAGWRDNWSGDLRKTTEGSTQVTTITFGGISERFTLQSGSWVATRGNGATLIETTANRAWTFRAADGTTITYETPLPSDGLPTTIFMPSTYCSSANAAACGISKTIQRPDGLVYVLTWQITRQYNYTTPGSPTMTSNVGYRLSDVRSSTGFDIKVKYISDEGGGQPFGYQGTTRPEWTMRASYRFFDLSEVSCSPTANHCDSVAGNWPTVTYSYPTSGSMDIVNSVAGTTRVTFGSGNISAVRRPGATTDTTVVNYDGSNRVNSITSDGTGRTYTYTTSGSTVTTVGTDTGSGGGSMTTVTDTTVGQPSSVTNATSNAVAILYDSERRPRRITQPEGNYVEYTRDTRGNIIETRTVDKSGVSSSSDIVTSANFDTNCSNPVTCNQPNYVIDALLNRTDFTYDPGHGGVTRVQMPAPTTGGIRPEINYTYTALQPQQLVNGNLTPVGNPVYKMTQMTSCSTAATCSGTANETRVTIAYNSPNLLPTSVTTASGDGAISLTTSYAYDTLDNLVAIDGPLAGAGDTTTFIIDGVNRRRGLIGPDPDGAGARVRVAERYTFDSASRITKVERGNVTAATAAALDAMTALQTLDVVYDANGNRIRETASSGSTIYNVIQYGYDSQQRLRCTALRMTPSTWSNLPTDVCMAVTVPPGGEADRITRNTYDANDRVTLVETGVGSDIASTEVATGYTPNGRVDYVIDGENNRTTYTYDGFDRLRQTRYPVTMQGGNSSNANDNEQLSYDKNGRIIERRLRDMTIIGLGYDNLGRLTSRDLPGSEPDATYDYDLAGRMVNAVQGGATSFIYDALGRTVSTTNTQGTVEYGYDAAGRRNRLDYTDSFYVTYDHDVLGNVTAIRENGAMTGAGVLATYGYDNLGRRSTVTYGNNTSQTLNFDNADRLTTLSNDLAGTVDDLSVSFNYNPASQIASATRNADAYAYIPTPVDRTDTINGLNRIMMNGLTTVVYDARGNLTTHGSSNYSYSADNQMLSGPNGATLRWDALGRLNRYSGGPNSLTLRLAYDGIDMISEHVGGAIARRYVHGPGTDDPIVWYEGSDTSDRRFLHSDERGSIVAITNSSGTVTNINRYDEYGVPATGNVGRFQYTGQQWLGEIALYHYKARMYAPHLGRFMQTDPIGYADGMNWYAYVGGDPVNFVDPVGLGGESVVTGPTCAQNSYQPRCNPTDPASCVGLLRRFGSIANCISYGYSGGANGGGGVGGTGGWSGSPNGQSPDQQRKNCENHARWLNSRVVQSRINAIRDRFHTDLAEHGFAVAVLSNGNVAVSRIVSSQSYDSISQNAVLSAHNQLRQHYGPSSILSIAFVHTHPSSSTELSVGDVSNASYNSRIFGETSNTIAIGRDGKAYCTNNSQPSTRL